MLSMNSYLNHTRQTVRAQMGILRVSKLVYFKTHCQLLELVESSVEMPTFHP